MSELLALHPSSHRDYSRRVDVDVRALDTFEFLVQHVCPQLTAFPDVESRVLPVLQNFFDSPDRIFNYGNTLQCTCYSADLDGDDPHWCPGALCLATRQNLEILEAILPDLRRPASPVWPFTAMLEETEHRAKTLKQKYALQSQAKCRTAVWVRHAADEGTPRKGADVTPSGQQISFGSIRSLPVEILREIIVQVQMDDPLAMLLLSHVNGAFRDISINTPSLWTKIDILDNHNITQLQLVRSNAAPLDVSMSLHRVYSDGTLRLASFICMLTSHYHRIEHVEANQPYKKWVQMALNLVTSSNLPRLKSLIVGLTWACGDSGPPEPEPERHSEEGLNLTTVFMCHVLVHSQSAILTPPVTHLKVKFTVFRRFIGLVAALQAMPSLQSLHLEALGFLENEDEDQTPKQEHIDLPDLHDLSLIQIDFLWGLNYLLENCLQTPSLRSFIWKHREYDLVDSHDFPNILNGILQSSPQLRRLELARISLSESGWRHAVHHLSTTVTDIRIYRCMFPGNAVCKIFGPLPTDGHGCCSFPMSCDVMGGHTGQVFLPNLRHLTLESEEELGLDAIRVALVARSRNGDAARLESLTIAKWMWDEEDEIEDEIAMDDLEAIRAHVDVVEITDQPVDEYIPEDDFEGDGNGSDWEESESSAQFSDDSSETDSNEYVLGHGSEGDIVEGSLTDEETDAGTRIDQLDEMGSSDSDQEDGSYFGSDAEEGAAELDSFGYAQLVEQDGEAGAALNTSQLRGDEAHLTRNGRSREEADEES